MCTADLSHTYESPHFKCQESQEGGKASLFRFPKLYRFEIRDSRSLMYDWAFLSLGNMLYCIRPFVTPAWVLYTQTRRDVSLCALPSCEGDGPSWAKTTGGEELAIMHYWRGNSMEEGEKRRGSLWCSALLTTRWGGGVKQPVADLTERFNLCSAAL